jgi:peptide/nickel transport system permease protein
VRALQPAVLVVTARHTPALTIGLCIVAALLGCAVLADWLAPLDPAALGPASSRLEPPQSAHFLGTDVLGRDVLTRLIHGSRVSLMVGTVSVLVAVGIGLVVGLAAGLGPTWLDRSLMAVADLLLAFPRIFLILLLVAFTAPSLMLVMVVIGLTGWMSVARLVRAEVLSLRERDFVAAARGLGMTLPQLALRHILPNVVPLVLVAATLRVGNAILLESFLSFLGLGAQEPTVSWGAMIEQGRHHLVDGWWLAVFPGIALTLAGIGFNLLADGMRDLLDPRQRGRERSEDV